MGARLAEVSVSTIGCGIMGGLLIERLLDAGAMQPAQITACDPDEGRLSDVRESLGVTVSTDNRDGAAANVILIAVPPPAVLPVIEEISGDLSTGQMLVSLAPGITIDRMRQVAGGAQVARVMPNTPSLVGAGMNAYCVAADAAADNLALLREMLDVWGHSVEIPEEAMNAACALVAVGPTYLFPIIATLMDAAVEAGLPAEVARRTTMGLFCGVSDLVARTSKTPEQLKQMISMQPLDDEAAAAVFREAYEKAMAGLRGLESKLMG